MNTLSLCDGDSVVVGKCLGLIANKETKVDFQVFDLNPDCGWQQWGKEIGATHVIHLRNVQQVRYIKLLKTVAFILIADDDNGPVWEKWPIKRSF